MQKVKKRLISAQIGIGTRPSGDTISDLVIAQQRYPPFSLFVKPQWFSSPGRFRKRRFYGRVIQFFSEISAIDARGGGGLGDVGFFRATPVPPDGGGLILQ